MQAGLQPPATAGRPRLSVFAAALLSVAAAGCAPGGSGDAAADGPAWLIIANAGEGAELSIDGVSMGLAGEFDGRDGRLELPAGAHALVVRRGGQTVLRDTVLLGEGETRTVVVP